MVSEVSVDEHEDPLNVLFIDDEADNLDAFVFNCEEFWNTHTVMDPRDVVSGTFQVAGHDAIIVDLVYDYPQGLTLEKKINPMHGLEVLAWLQTHHPKIPTIVLSAYLTPDIREHIRKNHPKVLCLDKPLDFSKAAFRKMVRNFIREYTSSA